MDQNLIISPNDKKQYLLKKLTNQLQVLIISDENTKISGACLEICVGMLDDPVEYQGLAHFCEHMLFMGSEKYPGQNDYCQFVQMHSGTYNASTWLQRTKYYFSIENDAFIEALDKFAQFFICPLFDPSCVEREMNAVESEFNLSLADDQCRMWEIFTAQTDENSTFHRFGCGNLSTLNKPDIRDQLLVFYDKYYCASLMKLVVQTNKPISEVEKQVEEIFSNVPNRGRQKPQHLDNPFKEQSMQIDVVGVKQEDVIYLSFIIPNYRNKYQNKPVSYITHVLGHEGKNSLASFLKDEGLVTELIVGSQDLNDAVSELYLTITLTQEGFENYQKVVGFVFQQIEIIKQKGVNQLIFDELAQIKQLDFKFKENSSSVLNYLESLSSNMHEYPENHIIYGDYAYSFFDESLIHEILNLLVPTNMILFVRSQEFDHNNYQIEPYCKTKYYKQPLDNEFHQIIKNCKNLKAEKTTKIIDIFPKNIYLPQQFNLVSNYTSNYPEILLQDDLIKCYYLCDSQFKVCKTSFGIQLFPVQEFVKDIKQRVLFELWFNIIYSQLEEQLYNAECAGINYNFDQAYNFFQFKAHGFSDSILKFYPDLIQYLVAFHSEPQNYVKKHIFDVQFEDLQDRYENYFMKSPYDLNFSYWKCIVYKTGKFFKEDLSEIDVTYKEFMSFTKKLINQLRIQIYFHGNINKEQALSLCSLTGQKFSSISKPNKSIHPLQIIKILPNQTLKFEKLLKENPEEPNSGIRVSFQGEQSLDPTAGLYFDLLNSIIADPFENQLRTNEQLGYVVYSTKNNRRGVSFFHFIIISETKSTRELVSRIDDFLVKFIQEELSQVQNQQKIEQFEKVKLSFYKDSSQDYQNMNEKFKDFWSEILINQNDFAKKQLLKERIDSITYEKFFEFATNLFKQSKRLEIHIVNEKHLNWELEHEKKINECEWFSDAFAM